MKLTELEISLKERRQDYLYGLVNDFVATLLEQGFTLAEVVDGLANYAWTNNNNCLDACFSLNKASLALAKSEGQRCQN